jgi:tetratricopeptide (TPR) repeat protein
MKAKIWLLIICTIIALCQERALYASETEGDAFVKAWQFYDQDKIEKASEIINKFNNSDSELRDGWVVLWASIYIKRGRYQEALTEVNKVRLRLERAYSIIENPEGQEKESVEIANSIRKQTIFLYYRMLIVAALANYKLDNCKEATTDFEIMYAMKEKGIAIENKNDKFDYFLALCYYKLKNYEDSILHFKSFYSTRTDIKEKDSAAYNIAALNALLGKLDESIHWLKTPIEHDKKLWVEKIKNDNDFDSARQNEFFRNFLEQQEQKMK